MQQIAEQREVTRLSWRKTLRDFLAEQVDFHGWSQQALGDVIGVSQGTAGRLLHESVIPREATLAKIAVAFDLPITEVRKMARRSVGEPDAFTWPDEFNQLPSRVRAALTELGWAYLDAAAERVNRGR